MKPAEVEALIRAGEGTSVELKSAKTPPQPERTRKAIVALANSGGGVLVYGVEDDGTVSGVGDRADADGLLRRVAQSVGQIAPALSVRLEVVEVQGMRVLVVEVPGFLMGRPFKADGKYYVRDGAISREARPEELRTLFLSTDQVTFDEQPIDGTSLGDLDAASIQRVAAVAYPTLPPEKIPAWLRSLHAVDATGRATVAGALLFSRDPSLHVRDAYITALRFPGDSVTTTLLAEEKILGPLLEQVERAVAFLRANVTNPSERVGLTRIDRGIPLEVWVEALSNAVAHRDYQVASQTRVFVFVDRVEIRNPGVLLNRLSIDGIRLGGVSQRRNPNVAAALARARSRDNAGLGVPEIFARVVALGLPEPEIDLASGEFRLVVRTRLPP